MNNQQVTDEPFDFSKYQVKNNSLPTEIPDKSLESQEPFDFNKYKVKEPPTKLEEAGRHVTRTGARITESILGFPGDFVGFAKYLESKLPGTPEIFKREPNYIQRQGKKALEAIPTSSDLKDMTSYLTSGFTDPQGAGEELSDEIASLATVLVSPAKAGQGLVPFLKNIGSSLLKSSAVKGSGKGAELLGADESTKSKVELATLFLSGFAGGKLADKFVGEQYKKARSAIPKGTMINTQGLAHSLREVDKELAKGVTTNTKNEVRSALGELKAKASGGAMEAEELVESYHNINERITSKKLFDELKSSEKKLLKSRYGMVQKEIGKEIGAYGQSNPEFYKPWLKANEGYSAIAQSRRVMDFLSSKKQMLPSHLLGSVAVDLFTGYPAAVGATVGGYGLIKTGELLARIAKSEALREHYMRVIMEAGNENLPGMIKHLNALDKEAKKIEDQ